MLDDSINVTFDNINRTGESGKVFLQIMWNSLQKKFILVFSKEKIKSLKRKRYIS